MGWAGEYFPTLLPAGYTLIGNESREDALVITYGNGTDTITFTESPTLAAFPAAEGADITYVQWNDVVAMRTSTGSLTQITWDQDEHSFSLMTGSDWAEKIAESVEKIQKK